MTGAFSYLRDIAAVTATTALLAVAATAALVSASKEKAAPPPAAPIRFQDLPSMAEDEMILVDYQSQSEYDWDWYYRYRFDGGAHPSVGVWAQGSSSNENPYSRSYFYHGHCNLFTEQLRSLDSLMDFYRSKKSNRSSRIDTILVQHYKAGRLLQQGRYRDASGVLENMAFMTPQERKKHGIRDPYGITLMDLMRDLRYKRAEPPVDQPEPEATDTPPAATPEPANK